MRQTNSLTRYAALLFPALLAVLLYGYAVRLPFFMDDGVLFALIRDVVLNQQGETVGFGLWGGNPPNAYYFTYYRPLVFSFWELHGQALGGRFDPVVLHWANVLVYALAGCGVSVLAYRLTGGLGRGKLLAGFMAGVVFVAFPFNYNAVTWVASMFHVVAVMGMTLAVYSGLAMLTARRPAITAMIAAFFAFVAVFSHENAVLTPVFLLLAIQVQRQAVNPLRVLTARRVWLALGAVSLPVAVYLGLFLTLPGVSSGESGLQPTMLDSLGVFLQGLVYPVAAAARKLLMVDASTGLFYGLTALTLIPLLWMLYRNARRLLWLAVYGIVWFVLAALPAVLFLEQSYIVGSWRLMLVSAVGMALLWGAALAALWKMQPRRLGRGIFAALVVWGVIVSGVFLTLRRDEALAQADYMRELKAEIDTHATGNRPLVINAPNFLAAPPEQRFFPSLGTGVIYVAGFVNWNLLYEAETGEPFPMVNALLFRETFAPPVRYSYAPFETFAFGTDFTTEVRNASDVYVTVFTGDDFYPLYAGSPDSAAPFDAADDTDLLAGFSEAGVVLINAEAKLEDPQTLNVDTRWRVMEAQTVMPEFTVTCDGEVVGQSALSIWGGIHPFRVWFEGETQTDRRTIPLNVPVTEDCLRVELVIVSDSTAESDRRVLADGGEVVEIEVESR